MKLKNHIHTISHYAIWQSHRAISRGLLSSYFLLSRDGFSIIVREYIVFLFIKTPPTKLHSLLLNFWISWFMPVSPNSWKISSLHILICLSHLLWLPVETIWFDADTGQAGAPDLDFVAHWTQPVLRTYSTQLNMVLRIYADNCKQLNLVLRHTNSSQGQIIIGSFISNKDFVKQISTFPNSGSPCVTII